MRKIFCLLLTILLSQQLCAQYNPDNPGDPGIYYTLEAIASPTAGGAVSPSSKVQAEEGDSVTCTAWANSGYQFIHWMTENTVVSTDRIYKFAMPAKNVVMTAVFEWNPANPDDPDARGYSHKINLTALPATAGRFNGNPLLVVEGDTTYVQAYANAGYTFKAWQRGGETISTENPLEVVMGTEDINLTATFTYTPDNPEDPMPEEITDRVANPVIERDGNVIRMHVSSDEATIYYTMNGETPDSTCTVYKDSIVVTHNCTIMAIAMQPMLRASEVVTFEVNWFKAAAVQFTQDGIRVSMATATENAAIHYTISNNGVGEQIYAGTPLVMTGDCTIEAYATRDGYLNSDTTSFVFHAGGVTCSNPTFARNENVITISTQTEGASIYYTTDGTDPTEQGTLYSEAITVDRNMTIKAIAVRDNWFNSAVAEYNVTSFKVSDVQFAQNGNVVTLSTATENAKIFYTLSTNGNGEQEYTAPLTMTGDCTIEDYATRDGYLNSDTTSFVFHAGGVTCSNPTFARNENVITISTQTDGASIYYTIDGTDPTEQSTLYSEPITVDRNMTIKAIAMRENYYSSQVATFVVDWFKVSNVNFLQNKYKLTLTTATEGAQIWYKVTPGNDGYVRYTEVLTMSDDCIVEAYATRDSYYNSDTTRYEFFIPVADYVFDGTTLHVKSVGHMQSVLQLTGADASKTIAAIIWDGDNQLTNSMMDGIDNPNLLLYVSNKSLAPGNVKNVVVGDSVNGYKAQQIVLKDTESGNGNFFCPIPFTANRITYEREFLQYTEPDSCRGWETIVLPFAVQSIMHERNGELSPFAGLDDERPFWLRELTTRGFIDAAQIEANKPYIISMPNYGGYDMEYQLGGWVTFSAYACNVPKTILQTAVDSTNTIRFIPAVCGVAQGDSVYALNVGEEYMIDHKKFAEGSVFVAGLDEVRPFRCYTQHVAAPAPGYHAPRYIPLAGWVDGDVTGIEKVTMNGYATAPMYNLNGQRVMNPKKGLYIVNGKKEIVK